MRLIDADELIEAINKSTCQWEYLWKRVVCDVIRNQPTAYDVEAVFAELEKLDENGIKCTDCVYNGAEDCFGMCSSAKFEHAISIVRNGGKE